VGHKAIAALDTFIIIIISRLLKSFVKRNHNTIEKKNDIRMCKTTKSAMIRLFS